MGIILHIPHSSREIPDKYRGLFYAPERIEEELEAVTDILTDELFDLPYPKAVFPWSRLVCDVERFREPEQEAMTACGMWVCYSRDSQGRPLKRLEEEYVEDMLCNYYDKHHAKLTQLVQDNLERDGKAVIVDCHSFPEYMPWLGEQSWPDMDICLGMDAYHTSFHLLQTLLLGFLEQGYSVAINSPFAGSMVPTQYYQQDKAVESIMIEVNRRLYYDEHTKSRKSGFAQVRADIGANLAKL